MIGRLIRQVWQDYVSNEDYIDPAVVPQELPASLKKLLKSYSREKKAIVEAYLVLDADHAYFVGRQGDKIDLLRAPTDDEGEFKNLDVASVPAAVLEGRDPRDVVIDAASEGAWD
jgi:glycerol-3-phosphate O-acyltransferase